MASGHDPAAAPTPNGPPTTAARPRAWLFWSSGKDSAYCLHVLRRRAEVDVVGLVTTVQGAPSRVAVHGVRDELLSAQADAVGLPLHRVPLPSPCPNDSYEQALAGVCAQALAADVSVLAFGDLFLQDIRAYRERQLAGTGLRAVFPLWGRDTRELAREMVGSGQRARIVCVDAARLDHSFAGREFDAPMLDDLPLSVDPCGENGEFHTFAFDGPAFRQPVKIATGAVTERDGMVLVDLISVTG